jgi:hypothetical protein
MVIGAAAIMIVLALSGLTIAQQVPPFTLRTRLFHFIFRGGAAIGFMHFGLGPWPAVEIRKKAYLLFLVGAVLAIPFFGIMSHPCPDDSDHCGAYFGFPWGLVIGTYGLGGLYLAMRVRKAA